MINKIHQRRRGVHCFLVSPPLDRLFCLAFALFLFSFVLKSTPLPLPPSFSLYRVLQDLKDKLGLCSMVIKKCYIDIDNLKIR